LRREFFWLLPLFLVIILALFGVHYLYLLQNGFDKENYITAFIILLPASAVIGYIFLAIALQNFQAQERNLEHLVRELLHEINLPISTIEANIEMLKKSEKESKNLKRLKRVSLASKRLQKLYRELSYQIKREFSPVEKESFDLAELVENEIEHFVSLGFDRFRSNLNTLKLSADRVGLEQVVANILENSLKYSSSVVEVEIVDTRLIVRDYGIGMSESEILNIYQRYYQSDSSKAGEGIGLAIVKRYCDENRVDLKINSQKGQGTTVTLEFSKIQSPSKHL
jgi:signal transduction histidine kinase